MSSTVAFNLLKLLIFVSPFAVAAQNIATGIVFLGLIFLNFGSNALETRKRFKDLILRFKTPTLIALTFVFTNIISTLLNSKNNANYKIFSYFFGHLFWIIGPLIIVFLVETINSVQRKKLIQISFYILFCWGLVSFSQFYSGWKFDFKHFSILDTIHRASGFYSHPLTLAYVALLTFPFALYSFINKPKKISPLLALIGSCLLVFSSLSKIVFAISLLVAFVLLFFRATKKFKIITVIGSVATLILFITIPNPVMNRFKLDLINKIDNQSGYAIDRFAFWHVHKNMWQERPLLGHGVHIDKLYRTPYYEQINLGKMKKKYEAHNEFLQTAVNGGVLGLILFLGYFIWIYKKTNYLDFHERVLFTSLISAYLLASLTQNSFHDSEVRYNFVLCIGALFLLINNKNNTHQNIKT